MHAAVPDDGDSDIGFNIIKKLEWPNENIKKIASILTDGRNSHCLTS